MKGATSWKTHKHNQRQKEESKNAEKRRRYEEYPSSKLLDKKEKGGDAFETQ